MLHRSYVRLIQQSLDGNNQPHSEFLQAAEARAAIVQIAVAPDLQLVAAADAWGYVCVWDHARVLGLSAEKCGGGQLDPLVARWKVSEGSVLGIQFTKHNGRICIMVLLPPVPPAVVNAISIFTLDQACGQMGAALGVLSASWQSHPSIGTDCLRYVDSLTSPVLCPPVHEEGQADDVHDASEKDDENEKQSLAADLASHVNCILYVSKPTPIRFFGLSESPAGMAQAAPPLALAAG
jgi:hypothetical protein